MKQKNQQYIEPWKPFYPIFSRCYQQPYFILCLLSPVLFLFLLTFRRFSTLETLTQTPENSAPVLASVSNLPMDNPTSLNLHRPEDSVMDVSSWIFLVIILFQIIFISTFTLFLLHKQFLIINMIVYITSFFFGKICIYIYNFMQWKQLIGLI